MTRTSGSSSRARATSSFARVMSAETVSWKTGTFHAAVSRRAIVLRMLVSGTDSTSPGRQRAERRAAPARRGRRGLGALDVLGDDPALGAGAAQAGELDAALAGDPARERAALMRPPFVVARGCGRRRLVARRLAACAARLRLGPRRARGALGGLVSAARGAALPDGLETSSPASPITATVCPTGTSPDCTAIFSSTPLASASTSCVALSVSSS